jgi:hypothetical protein
VQNAGRWGRNYSGTLYGMTRDILGCGLLLNPQGKLAIFVHFWSNKWHRLAPGHPCCSTILDKLHLQTESIHTIKRATKGKEGEKTKGFDPKH